MKKVQKIEFEETKEIEQKKHKEKKESDRTCTLCFIKLYDKQARDRNIRRIHKSDMDQQEKEKEKNTTSVCEKCPSCGKMFKHEHSLKRHMKNHEIEDVQSFECHVCKKKFGRKDNLWKHERNQHKTFKIDFDEASNKCKNICQICSADFGTEQDQFFYHIANKVCQNKEEILKLNDQGLFQCEICDKAYYEKQNLQRHIRWKHNSKESSKNFKCEQCDIYFGYKST